MWSSLGWTSAVAFNPAILSHTSFGGTGVAASLHNQTGVWLGELKVHAGDSSSENVC